MGPGPTPKGMVDTDDYKTRPKWGVFTIGHRRCVVMCRQNQKWGSFNWSQFPLNLRVPLRQPKFGRLPCISCCRECLKSISHHTFIHRVWIMVLEYWEGARCMDYMVWKIVEASITGWSVVYEQKLGWKWCKAGRGRVWRLKLTFMAPQLVSITLTLISTGQIQLFLQYKSI